MSGRRIIIVLVAFLIVVLVPVTNAFNEGDGADRRGMSARSTPALARSSGEYMGRPWHIDENHLMWWDHKPYVRFGFTGTGNPIELMKLGFSQFTLMPAEEWPISGPDPAIVQSVNEASDQLEEAGATYYGILNTFWPWRYGNLIGKSDKAVVFVRDVQDVTEHSGQDLALDLEIRLPISEDDQ